MKKGEEERPTEIWINDVGRREGRNKECGGVRRETKERGKNEKRSRRRENHNKRTKEKRNNRERKKGGEDAEYERNK